MKKNVLVVLGAPNSSTGKLSGISKSRLDCCAKHYSKGTAVLCTGGWGKQFNTSEEAHAVYAKIYLQEKGVLEQDFLDSALSENTVDDAVKIKSIISVIKKVKLIIITSDYHIERVRLIFEVILNEYDMKFVSAKSPLSKSELQPLLKHEQKAIESIKRKGLYF